MNRAMPHFFMELLGQEVVLSPLAFPSMALTALPRPIAVGEMGAIFTSSDGIEWHLDQVPFDGSLNGITCANGKIFVVGENGVVLTADSQR
jgi:hypothetical protein